MAEYLCLTESDVTARYQCGVIILSEGNKLCTKLRCTSWGMSVDGPNPCANNLIVYSVGRCRLLSGRCHCS